MCKWFFATTQEGIVKQAQGHIDRLGALQEHGVNVYKYNHWPMASLMRVDDVMFYSPYIYCIRGAESPVFRIVREVGKPNDLFDTLHAAFEMVIARVNSPQPPKNVQRTNTLNEISRRGYGEMER